MLHKLPSHVLGCPTLWLNVSSTVTLSYTCAYQNELLKSHILFTETEMSSFWRNFHHCLHRKLSFWQLPMQPVIKISSKWQHFRCSVPRPVMPKYAYFSCERLSLIPQSHETNLIPTKIIKFERSIFIPWLGVLAWDMFFLTTGSCLSETVVPSIYFRMGKPLTNLPHLKQKRLKYSVGSLLIYGVSNEFLLDISR